MRRRPLAGSRSMRFPLLISFLAFAPQVAFAQGAAPQAKPEMNESCPDLVAQNRDPFPHLSLKDVEVRINYVGHSTFLIESPKLVRIATDYNDYVRTPV